MTDLEALFTAAQAARLRAHAPYSRFRVGAAIRDERGAVNAGCNVENAAYPLGACAEANAIGAMVAGGGALIRDLVVIGAEEEFTTPCGGCRQRIAEFADAATRIHMRAAAGGPVRTRTLAELLPEAFGPRLLGGEG